MKITHKQVQEYSKLICENIKKSGEIFDQILIITKGGLIPGYYFAKELGIKGITTLNINSYNNGYREKISDHTLNFKIIPLQKYLIVDDLVDSGKTIEYIKNVYFKNYSEYKIATLFHKEGSIIEPNWCYSYNHKAEEWIEFEYEL